MRYTASLHTLCRLLQGVCILLVGLGPAGDILAQVSAKPIEEVLVTAQKREESIRDVGISMFAFNPDEIQHASQQHLAGVAEQVANVEMFEDYGGGGLPTWVIRGVGLQDFNANNAPAAAVYIDEVYQASTAMGAQTLFDVERVEVLKGPQGGLYGRNTSGGAVKLVSRKASVEENEGYLELGYGRWNELRMESGANVVFAEDLAMRFAGVRFMSGDAWQTSLSSGDSHGEQDRWDLRLGTLYRWNDQSQLYIKIYGGKDDSEIPLGRSIGLYDEDGTLCGPVEAGRRDPDNCLAWADVNRLSQGLSRLPLNQQSDDGRRVLSDPLNHNSHDYYGLTVTGEMDLGVAELTSITAYDRFGYGVNLDLDGAPGQYGHRPSSSDMASLSQELRLASTSDRGMAWLVGLAASNDDFDEERLFLLRDNVQVGLVRGELSYRQYTQTRSAYGQLSLPLSESLDWVMDLRYSDVEKAYREGNFRAPALPPPDNVFASDLGSDYRLSNHLAGRLQLKWRPAADTLIYASLARGFKEGGFYGGFPFRPEEVAPYDEETILAYEAGVKHSLIDNRLFLDAALFHYDYRDVQGFVTREILVTDSRIDLLTNQGDARHRGVEVELSWLVANGFFLRGSLGYLDAQMTASNGTTRNLEGELVPLTGQRPYAPYWSLVLNAGWQYDLPFDWRGEAALNVNYRSDFGGHFSSPSDRAVGHLPGYTLTDGRVDFTSPDSRISLAFWVRNLLDEAYITRIKNDGLGSFIEVYGQPRSWGLDLTYRW